MHAGAAQKNLSAGGEVRAKRYEVDEGFLFSSTIQLQERITSEHHDVRI